MRYLLVVAVAPPLLFSLAAIQNSTVKDDHSAG